MQVLTIRNPRALENPDLQAFLERAVRAFPFSAGPQVGLGGVLEDFIAFIRDPDFWLFVGVEKGDFRAMAVMQRGVSKMFPCPTIFCFYNEGSAALKRAVKDQILATVKDLGYTRFRTANMSGHPDKVWLKAFGHEEVEFKPVGTIFEMSLK